MKFQNYLKSVYHSGGTADRSIRLWNTTTGACLRSIDTGSQVCAMQFNEHHRELLSSHGFSDNQLILWKFPSMMKIKEFTGHTMRVLHMSKSPDGQTVCTASPDESLRFWDIFHRGDGASARDSVRPNMLGVTPVREKFFGRTLSGTPTIR